MLPPQPQQQQQQQGFMNPPDIHTIAQQGYLVQQQQLQALQMRQAQQAQMAQMGQAGQMSQVQQMQLQQMQQMQMAQMTPGHVQSSGSSKKKAKPRPSPASQMLPRAAPSMLPPHPPEHYLRNAMQPPPQHPPHPVMLEAPEPWADALDEIDSREVAMSRFRARQEMLTEVFSPDPIRKRDPWEGLGMDGETLEAKVLVLEKENETLEIAINTASTFERPQDPTPVA
ncbi:hypothetical protein TREMEDRAFT_60644 [Tremella mesenterica DSM 1558]|uniref:uncharacterized protein n=1 Tax=Tremella mesenterica (strain ATCC 24925 / CBS 8224 / DSM 1558 / NBRC 9311 / NRRL Y-6157 / RJB 2259-6 / UBC 559-6) TaxID=578456 RepID=UPI0003F49C19|nr:uncharacterized protein TREMEDRAFT_60644 [Tremella mesenterica DSM 1558]EIW71728.1 hypothetical protein TREMEDRAFT_60644 [Tremella mesenterica DSM 1558]